MTGFLAWSIKNVFGTIHFYNKSLFQFGGYELKIYDSKTGKLEDNVGIHELKENKISVSSNLTDLERNVFYFTTYMGTGEKKNALLGTINLTNYESDFYEIHFDSNTVDVRSPIGRPFVNDKSIYIEIGKNLRRYNFE